MSSTEKITISQIVNGNEVELITSEVEEEVSVENAISDLLTKISINESIWINNGYSGAYINKIHGPVKIKKAPEGKPLI